MYFCDTLYEDVGKTPVLVRQRGRGGVNFVSTLHGVTYECPPSVFIHLPLVHPVPSPGS